jgi:prefoldin subunit 5
MMDMTELERMIETMRAQAQALNATADQLEASIKPWKIMQAQMQTWQQLSDEWNKLWLPPKQK